MIKNKQEAMYSIGLSKINENWNKEYVKKTIILGKYPIDYSE